MFEFREKDDVIVVGFGGEKVLGEAQVRQLKADLKQLFEEQDPRALEFDLNGVVLITNEMWEFLISLLDKVNEITMMESGLSLSQIIGWNFKVAEE